MSADLQSLLLARLNETLQARLPRGRDLPFQRVAREFLQIRTEDNRVEPFVLRAIQRRYLAAKRLSGIHKKPPRFLLLKYRRGGFTTVEQGLSYFMASRRRNVTVATLAQDGGTTARIFRIARLMHERDPRAPLLKGPGNQYRLEFPGLNSIFYLMTAAGRGVARGDTLSRVHWSEVAWSCPGYNQLANQRDLLTGLSEAASHGEMVLETTPNGSELFRELYIDAKAGKNDWTPIFLPWFQDPRNCDPVEKDEPESILSEVDEEEARLIKSRGLDSGQIKWRRRKVRELRHLFPQEYPEDDHTCWLISGVSFFDNRLVLQLRDECLAAPLKDDPALGAIPADSTPVPGGYEVSWEEPERGVEYCIGVDTSEGIPGCDYGGLGVMRRDNGRQVAAVHGLFKPSVLAGHAGRWSQLYNDALVGVERENHGHAVLQKLMELGVDKPHFRGGSLYFVGADASRGRDEHRTARAGWSTNSVTRPLLLEGLRDWVEADNPHDRVRDRQMLNEMLTFRMQENGSFRHDSGYHDDSIFKWGIANQMRAVPWRRKQVTVHAVNRYT